MSHLKNDPSSFRDPAGQIFLGPERVFRSISPSAKDEFTAVHTSGLLKELIQQKKLLDYTILSDAEKKQLVPEAAILLEHPKLPFISYSYEWSFKMLQAAALLQLELQLTALTKDITLIDASSFNIQFLGSTPYFIDHLSFRPYIEGDIWWGYQQFCQQFLNPLLLQAYCGIDFQAWLKGNLGNIALTDIYQVLPWYRKLNWRVFFHIGLQTKLQQKSSEKINARTKKIHLPKSALINLLHSIQNWVSTLKPHYQTNVEWQHYEDLHLYTEQALVEKRSFIAEFCQKIKPLCLWDLGCNQGEYAKLALENSALYVIGFDYHAATIDKAFRFSQNNNLNFLPLVQDFTMPSPALGWNQKERKSLAERNNATAILALALIHHLRIQNNISLPDIITYLLSLAPNGVIEFVPKNDPKVQLLLKFRKDIFSDYNFENFIYLLTQHASIIKIQTLHNTERQLIWYQTHV